MEAAVDRRMTEGSRVSLEVPVELAHAGHEEKFIADAINLGLGGLTMRAPYLPDIGQALTCRFETGDGQSIEAGAEVAWSDPSAGQFGLHFVSVPAAAKKTLREVVLGPPPAYGEPLGASRSDVPPVAAAQTYSLRLADMDEPLPGRLLARSSHGLTFERMLPELQPDSSFIVDDTGAIGRLGNVHLSLEDGRPRLILDVVYETGSEDPRATSDATIPDFLLCEEPTFLVDAKDEVSTLDLRPAPGTGTPASRADAAAFGPDEPAPSPLFREEEVADAIDLMLAEQAFDEATTFSRQPRAEQAEAEPSVAPVDEKATEAEVDAGAAEPSVSPAVYAEELKADAATDAPPSVNTPVAAKAFQRLGADLSVARRWMSQVALWVAGAWNKTRDWLHLRGAPLLSTQVGQVRRRVSRRASQFAATMRAAVRRVRAENPRLGFGRRAKRKTAPAPRGSNVSPVALRREGRRRGHGEPLRRLRWGRWLLAALVAGVGIAVLAPTMGSEQTVASAESSLAPKPAFLALAKLSVTEGTPVERAASSSPSMDSGNRDIESNSHAATRGGSTTLPPDSPYAVDVTDSSAAPEPAETSSAAGEALRFGEASVPGGENYVLRMSQPVTRLEGRAADNGFSIVIPGTLSLDRAGPLARSHPLVEHSTILNRGDHAELSVRFVEGRKPAYRVRGRGSSVEITIAQR